jgi:hypothetical protein
MKRVTLDDLKGARPARVWVTRPDQSIIVMDGPQVFRGKLVGFVDRKYRELAPSELEQITMRKLAGERTAALIAGGVLGAVAVVLLISGTEDTFDYCVGSSVDCEPMMVRAPDP